MVIDKVISKQRVAAVLVRQFHNPTGVGGHLAGWVMARRSSNVARSRWAVALLDVAPADRVLEIGCGPGVAIGALAARATAGHVVGVDRSDLMIRQARRRNARAAREGRVRLIASAVEDLPAHGTPPFDVPFDAVLAINTVGFWTDPVSRLAELRAHLAPGGRIALVSQPRGPGATASTSAAAAAELVELLARAGFTGPRVETLALDPPAVCVLAST
jgi:SAM-dependent methyltransferase